MAFEVNPEATNGLPESLEGLYVLPYEWFNYGLGKGHLIIESLDFYDTVQGSMFLTLDIYNCPESFKDEESGIIVPYWYLYRSGSGVISGVYDEKIISGEHHARLVTDSHYRFPVAYVGVQRLSQLPPAQQKLMNESLIQLFKGSKVKLEHSVWF